jgi:hypothetical protein
MARLGIPMAQNDLIAETIEDQGGRALHGDVTLEFVQAESPLEIVREMKADVAALPNGRTALLLYDALKDLQRDRPESNAIAEEPASSLQTGIWLTIQSTRRPTTNGAGAAGPWKAEN